MGFTRRFSLLIALAASALMVGVAGASSDSTNPSSDFSVSIGGNTAPGENTPYTYTATATNNGPDPGPAEMVIRFRVPKGDGPNGQTEIVGGDPDCHVDDAMSQSGVWYVDCTDFVPAPVPVGAKLTEHISVEWTSQGQSGVAADVSPGRNDDPNLSNDTAGIAFYVTPSGTAPGGGGGGGGSGGGGAPTPSPTFTWLEPLPHATQYLEYPGQLFVCGDICGVTVALTSGALPPGLTLNSIGQLYGRPNTPGTFTFSVLGTQGFGSNGKATSSHTFTLVVEPYRSPSSAGSNLVLPNHTRTPGVTNSVVRQTTIKKTICVSGWAATVRPPASYTNTLKLKQMKQYGEAGGLKLYEEDELIPLELGGAAKNPKNLWPEPRTQSKHSDPLEISLKRKVCAGSLTLAAARKQILAYKRTNG